MKDVPEKLEKEAHRIASVMYGAQNPPGAGGPPPPDAGSPTNGDGAGKPEGGKKEGQVIDAEFEENA